MSENRYKLVPILLKDIDGIVYEYMVPTKVKQHIIKLYEEIIDDLNEACKIAKLVRGY